MTRRRHWSQERPPSKSCCCRLVVPSTGEQAPFRRLTTRQPRWRAASMTGGMSMVAFESPTTATVTGAAGSPNQQRRGRGVAPAGTPAIVLPRPEVLRRARQRRSQPGRHGALVLLERVTATVAVAVLAAIRATVGVAVTGARVRPEALLPQVAQPVSIAVLRGIDDAITVRVPVARAGHAPARSRRRRAGRRHRGRWQPSAWPARAAGAPSPPSAGSPSARRRGLARWTRGASVTSNLIRRHRIDRLAQPRPESRGEAWPSSGGRHDTRASIPGRSGRPSHRRASPWRRRRPPPRKLQRRPPGRCTRRPPCARGSRRSPPGRRGWPGTPRGRSRAVVCPPGPRPERDRWHAPGSSPGRRPRRRPQTPGRPLRP